jgi:hypothetical protein
LLEIDGAGTIAELPVASPDVCEQLQDESAATCRFVFGFRSDASEVDISRAKLRIEFESGPDEIIETLMNMYDPAHALYGQFLDLLHRRVPARFLEIGARARSGIVRKDVIPPGWQYTGFDIVAGPNVDVVGDAHELSSYLPRDSCEAVMAIAVIEHLLMPWKFALELNSVMAIGGIGLFMAPQSWPTHDEPWDYWRLSKYAWDALFNASTGFRILDAQMGEPAVLTPTQLRYSTCFEGQRCYLVSSVIVEKTSTSSLRWDVSLPQVVATQYPH